MKPRVGFLGTGWIGRHRMAAMIETGAIEAVAICDPSDACAAEAAKLAPGAQRLESLEGMLAARLDGLVIATPSALHAEQSIRALDAGVAVFCQKPLGRDEGEVRAVIEAARRADRLLAVDLSYRFTEGAQRIAELVRGGSLGRVFAADLTFHNAYGPDKAWFRDPALSGGGCMIDLGVHLVDLALWMLDFPEIDEVTGDLRAGGEPLQPGQVEDYAVASFKAGDVTVRIACSWHLHAGHDAVIDASFYGTEGGAALRNVGGSFYDFTAERFAGTSASPLATPPDDWGGRAAAAWARQLAERPQFDPAAEALALSARVLDRVYGRGEQGAGEQVAVA